MVPKILTTDTDSIVLLKESLSLIVTLGGIRDENEDRAEWIGNLQKEQSIDEQVERVARSHVENEISAFCFDFTASQVATTLRLNLALAHGKRASNVAIEFVACCQTDPKPNCMVADLVP